MILFRSKQIRVFYVFQSNSEPIYYGSDESFDVTNLALAGIHFSLTKPTGVYVATDRPGGGML